MKLREKRTGTQEGKEEIKKRLQNFLYYNFTSKCARNRSVCPSVFLSAPLTDSIYIKSHFFFQKNEGRHSQ